jgi:hypothetical protein
MKTFLVSGSTGPKVAPAHNSLMKMVKKSAAGMVVPHSQLPSRL